jgi:uncharacterized protein
MLLTMQDRLKTVAIALLLCVINGGAQADFEDAIARYKAKDYPTALHEFRRLAEIGDHSSQFNLGVMYLHGRGVEKDLIQAFAWMALACQENRQEWVKARDALFSSLSDTDKSRATDEQGILATRFSDESLARDMAPNLTNTEGGFRSSRIVKHVMPEYPIEMRREGRSGQVILRFAVAPDGTTRLHTVVTATNITFAVAALDAIKRFQFEPSRVNGKPVEEYGLTQQFNFSLSGAEYNEKRIYNLLEASRTAAKKGDAKDAYEYASTITHFSPFVKMPPGTENPNYWFWQAAGKGDARAQFELGNHMLYGNMCSADAEKGIRWLRRAAEMGQPEAQYVLGMNMLSGARLAQDRAAAIGWLQRAADRNFSIAKLRLAWIYATTGDVGMRDPQMAQMFLMGIPDGFIDKLTLRQTEAAVAAALGRFSKAVILQQEAISEAEHYDLPVEELQNQVRAYKGGKAWVDPV